MRMLIVYVFISALMFGCSSEKPEETAEADAAPISAPKLEALPDWDSLPPIEEE